MSTDTGRWMRRNSKYFNVSEESISLSKTGQRILNELQKELVVNDVTKLAFEVKKSPSGRPTIGRAKMLKGFQSPIYEIRVEKDLRLLYHVIIGKGGKNLLISEIDIKKSYLIY